MAVQQTSCYQVVNIKYLKDFCSGVVAPSETKGLTYCPTYGELTGGTIITTWSQGTTPAGDRNGIVVSSDAVLGGTYANNQCVDQRDLSLRYTILDGITVTASPTRISACGGDSTLSYSKSWTRYTKFMDSSCTTATTSTAVTDTTSGGVTWSVTPTSGATLSGNKLTLGKNTGTASRSYTVKGTYGTKSDTKTVSQSAVTWSWVQSGSPVTTYSISAYRISPSDGIVDDCDGGTYTANAKGSASTVTTYVYQDSCGAVSGSPSSTTVTSSETLTQQSGTFNACEGTDSETASLIFTYHGESASVSFTHDCSECMPQICDFLWVDTGHADSVPASGSTNNNTCDSAFVNTVKYPTLSKDNIVPVIVPATASTWVHPEWHLWDEDKGTWSYWCTIYDWYACAANNVMYHALGNESNPYGIPYISDPSSCPNAGSPASINDITSDVVKLALTGTSAGGTTEKPYFGHCLAVVDYNIDPNTSEKPRSCTIMFAINSGGTISPCTTSLFTINQLGTGSTCSGSLHASKTALPASGGSGVQIGTWDKKDTCTSDWSAVSYPNWMSNVVFSADGNVYADLAANTSTKSRTGTVQAYLEGYGYDSIKDTQEGSTSTYFYYTVYSNIEGSKVKFTDGANIYITNGYATRAMTTNATQTVTISHDGCTFSPATANIVANGSTTLNGNCTVSDMTITTILVNNTLATVNFNRLVYILSDGSSAIAVATSPGYTLSTGQSGSFTFTISSAYRGTTYSSLLVYDAGSSKTYSTSCKNGTITDATTKSCNIG